MTTWQVQAAKQRLSEVLRAAEGGEPQFITRHGQEVAVVIDIADYRATHEVPRSLTEFLLSGPTIDDLDIPPRLPETDRPIDGVDT